MVFCAKQLIYERIDWVAKLGRSGTGYGPELNNIFKFLFQLYFLIKSISVQLLYNDRKCRQLTFNEMELDKNMI